MLITGAEIVVVHEFAIEISKHLKVTIGNKPSTHYNGLDIIQTKEGIKISCETYINKLRVAHGWEGISNKKLEPIDPNKVKELESTEGPHIDSDEGRLLKEKNSFNYMGVVGEIVCLCIHYLLSRLCLCSVAPVSLQHLPCAMSL